MSLFGQLLRTTVNIVTLPVAVVMDVVTLGGTVNERRELYLEEALEKLKVESEDERV